MLHSTVLGAMSATGVDLQTSACGHLVGFAQLKTSVPPITPCSSVRANLPEASATQNASEEDQVQCDGADQLNDCGAVQRDG